MAPLIMLTSKHFILPHDANIGNRHVSRLLKRLTLMSSYHGDVHARMLGRWCLLGHRDKSLALDACYVIHILCVMWPGLPWGGQEALRMMNWVICNFSPKHMLACLAKHKLYRLSLMYMDI